MKRVPYVLVAILLMAGLMVMAGCGGGGTSDDGETPNSPPFANAGSNHSAQVGDTVSFLGTGTDADGSIATGAVAQQALQLMFMTRPELIPQS